MQFNNAHNREDDQHPYNPQILEERKVQIQHRHKKKTEYLDASWESVEEGDRVIFINPDGTIFKIDGCKCFTVTGIARNDFGVTGLAVTDSFEVKQDLDQPICLVLRWLDPREKRNG